MNIRPRLQLSPPANWLDFETICWGIWKVIWGDNSAQKNGRQGQPQKGVDIFGRPANTGNWAGVQCKGKENLTGKKLKKREILNEANKAKGFIPRLVEYTIATTAPRDAKIQQYARQLTDKFIKKGWFRITICGWDDIVDLLYIHEPPEARTYYPDAFGTPADPMASLFNNIFLGDRRTLESFKPGFFSAESPIGRCNFDFEHSDGSRKIKLSINMEISESNREYEKVSSNNLEFTRPMNEDGFQAHTIHGVASRDASLVTAVEKAIGRKAFEDE